MLPAHQHGQLLAHQLLTGRTPEEAQTLRAAHDNLHKPQNEQDAKPAGSALRESLLRGVPPLHEAKPANYPSFAATKSGTPASTAVASAAVPSVKGEPSFNLYGYQPYHTVMPPDKVYSRGLKEEKDTKAEPQNLVMPKRSSDAKLVTSPAKYGSVIVENRSKEMKLEAPLAHSAGSITLGTARQGVRATSPTNHAVSAPGIVAAKSGTQSPLQVASPHQLSAAVMQPMELQKRTAQQQQQQTVAAIQPPHKGAPPVPSTTTPNSAATLPAYMMGAPTATTAQAAAAASYSYSLIQQGLVPNPIYSAAMGAAATSGAPDKDRLATGTSQVSSPSAAPRPPAGTPSPSGGATKRRAQKELNPAPAGKKKSKVMETAVTPERRSVPPTTADQLLGVSTTTVTMAVTDCGPMRTVSYMDTFRNFVENAVQSAFYQDQELGKAKAKSKESGDSTPKSTSSPQPVAAVKSTGPATPVPGVVTPDKHRLCDDIRHHHPNSFSVTQANASTSHDAHAV